MIAYLTGTIEDIDDGSVILDVNGIGYEIKVADTTLEYLAGERDTVKIHTYMQVREDDVTLFGFVTKDELKIFKLLITVNGIGPKGALAILSTLSPDDLRMAVASADAKAISKAPGVGIKTAQRVILDLKDKLKIEDMFEHFTDRDMTDTVSSQGGDHSSAKSEAIMALVSLGYSQQEAASAIKKAGDISGMDTEQILKIALRHMSMF